MMLKLFVVTEDAIVLAGLMAMLDRCPDNRVTMVGQAKDGHEGARFLDGSRFLPDVVVFGEPTSKRTIYESAWRIADRYHKRRARPNMMVLSQKDEDDRIFAALRVGISGYITHIESEDELLRAVHIVAGGGAAFSRSVASRLGRYFSGIRFPAGSADLATLTDRELQVLESIAEGMDNKEIAQKLFLAEKTVRNYVTRVFSKLDVHDRASAAVRARDAGLGRSDDGASHPAVVSG